MTYIFSDKLVTIIVNSRYKEDAIIYIETHYSQIRVPELNQALDWAGKDFKDFKGKQQKYYAILDYLKNDYNK
jgi:hypothetical protein